MSKVLEPALNHFPPVPDFTPLIYALHELAQTLLSYSQVYQEAKGQDQSEQHLEAVQGPQAETTPDSGLHEPQEASKGLAPVTNNSGSTPEAEKAPVPPLFTSKGTEGREVRALSPPTSKRGRRRELRELYKAFHFDSADTEALAKAYANHDRAKIFERVYASGSFFDEIRYYLVPSHLVRLEHNLLGQHHPKDLLDLLAAMQNDLKLKSKHITDNDQDINFQTVPSSCLSIGSRAHALAQPGGNISEALKLLLTFESHLKDIKLIHKTMLPWPQK